MIRFRSIVDSRKFAWIEAILIFACLLTLFILRIPAIEFHGDESQWIGTSNVFEAFLSGDIHSSVWEDNYWSEAFTVIPRYIIGIGRNIGGFRADNLNNVWLWSKDYAYNVANGAMPSPSLLWWSRFPMAVLAAGSGIILFLLIVSFAGRIIGYLATLMFALNGSIQLHLIRAMSESPMLFFICVTILVSVIILSGVPHLEIDSFSKFFNKRLWAGWLLTGLFLGAATASKNNSGSMFIGLVGLWVLLTFFNIHFKTNILRIGFVTLGAASLAIMAAIFFVIVNPYLYPDIITNTLRIVQLRFNLNLQQQSQYPLSAITGFLPRITIVPKRIFENYALINFQGAWILNLVFFILGLVYFIIQIRKSGRNLNWSGMAIVLVGGSAVVPMLFTPLDWDRYYLLPIVFSQIFIASGVIFLLKRIVLYFKVSSHKTSFSQS